MPQSLLIAAPASGSGKTTVTLALLAALRIRGLQVAPFKVGPDFIDPGHHALAAGRVSRNLDGWMCGRDGVAKSFAAGCDNADLAIIEGVMGLFDGARGDADDGSSAEIARWLDARVLLVVDARSQARSVAALIKGFVDFEPRLQFAGVILNRVGSDRHAQLLREALASTPGLPPLLGCLPRDAEVELPSRHLGLVTADDGDADYARLGAWLEQHLDLDALLEQLGSPPLEKRGQGGFRSADKIPLNPPLAKGEVKAKLRIGVARDRAFCFCYPENLEALQGAGAELAFFSPLDDSTLPEGIDGLYLPGGYPELHAPQLAANRSLLAAIRDFAAAGRPVYAECGGLIYLSQGVGDHDFVGLVPARARMLEKRKALGYRQVTLACASPLGPAGTSARGHEFHYSELDWPAGSQRAYTVCRADGQALDDEGYIDGNLLASYVHLHFASNPALADNFVQHCLNR